MLYLTKKSSNIITNINEIYACPLGSVVNLNTLDDISLDRSFIEIERKTKNTFSINITDCKNNILKYVTEYFEIYPNNTFEDFKLDNPDLAKLIDKDDEGNYVFNLKSNVLLARLNKTNIGYIELKSIIDFTEIKIFTLNIYYYSTVVYGEFLIDLNDQYKNHIFNADSYTLGSINHDSLFNGTITSTVTNYDIQNDLESFNEYRLIAGGDSTEVFTRCILVDVGDYQDTDYNYLTIYKNAYLASNYYFGNRYNYAMLQQFNHTIAQLKAKLDTYTAVTGVPTLANIIDKTFLGYSPTDGYFIYSMFNTTNKTCIFYIGTNNCNRSYIYVFDKIDTLETNILNKIQKPILCSYFNTLFFIEKNYNEEINNIYKIIPKAFGYETISESQTREKIIILDSHKVVIELGKEFDLKISEVSDMLFTIFDLKSTSCISFNGLVYDIGKLDIEKLGDACISEKYQKYFQSHIYSNSDELNNLINAFKLGYLNSYRLSVLNKYDSKNIYIYDNFTLRINSEHSSGYIVIIYPHSIRNYQVKRKILLSNCDKIQSNGNTILMHYKPNNTWYEYRIYDGKDISTSYSGVNHLICCRGLRINITSEGGIEIL